MSEFPPDDQSVCDFEVAGRISHEFRTIVSERLDRPVKNSCRSEPRPPLPLTNWEPFPIAETTIMVDDNEAVVCRVRTMLIEAVGGYTETDAIGAWRDDGDQIIHDHSKVFTVAGLSSKDLERIVDCVLRDQQAVYVRKPDGTSGLFTYSDQAAEKAA